MNGLQIFVSEEFGNIRTVTIDNEPWFVGKDVAEALGYERAADAIRQHVEADDKGVGEIQTPGGTQRMVIINESGLYALIFGSRLESAKRFKRWVTAEVLPALRRTGTYSMDNYSPEMQAILMHDTKIVNIEHRMDKLENEIPMYGIEADELSGHVKRKGVQYWVERNPMHTKTTMSGRGCTEIFMSNLSGSSGFTQMTEGRGLTRRCRENICMMRMS